MFSGGGRLRSISCFFAALVVCSGIQKGRKRIASYRPVRADQPIRPVIHREDLKNNNDSTQSPTGSLTRISTKGQPPRNKEVLQDQLGVNHTRSVTSVTTAFVRQKRPAANKSTAVPAPATSTTTSSNLTLALCHPTLFGEPNLQAVLHFVEYYRNLGVDHFFFWHLPHIQERDSFEVLQALPHVTMTPHKAKASGYYDQPKIQALCLSDSKYAANYDWALAIDADEYLWFAQPQTAQQFLQQYADYDLLSFGKWEYSTRFVAAAKEDTTRSSSLFGLSQYPFTAQAFCVSNPRENNGSGCPNWQGRAKFWVRPQKLQPKLRSVVHGSIQKQPRSLYIPAQQAHFKEFYGILITNSSNSHQEEKRPPHSFEVGPTEYERVGLPNLNRGYDLNENGNITMLHDESLIDWLQFVQSLAAIPQRKEGQANTAKTGGLSHYKTSPSSGWNNQRQSAMVAWIIAYLTGHTFQLKPYLPARTGVKSDKTMYSHGTFWDMNHLQKYVSLQNTTLKNTGRGYEYGVFINSVFSTPQEVTELQKYKSITYAATWSCLQKQFPWLDPWGKNAHLFGRMMESFTYTAPIQTLADQVVQAMGGGPFIALHIRKERLPAVDCQELDRRSITGRDRYSRGGCDGIDWNYVLQQLFPNNTLPFYVATDGSFSASNWTTSVDNPVIQQATDMPFLRRVPWAMVSAVEQLVASRAEYFVASTHSSWSEYVIYKRALTKKDGKKNYNIWVKNLEIFTAKK